MEFNPRVLLSTTTPPARPVRPTLKQAAGDFAAIFTHELLKHAWKARGMLSGGREAEAFYDQLSWEYSRVLAHRDSATLTSLIIKSLSPRSHNKESGSGAEDGTALQRKVETR